MGWAVACQPPADVSLITPAPRIQYSFFVAGHTYGHPGSAALGLHPPFKARFPLINAIPTMAFGVLTGDMVKLPTNRAWDAIDQDLGVLHPYSPIPDSSFTPYGDREWSQEKGPLPVHFVAGNHDVINRTLYHLRYGPSFYDFSHQHDLFIVLDANLAHWNIEGNQLTYLQQILTEKAPLADRIFVFFHQQLWFDESNIFHLVKPNSFAGRAYSINFWTEIEPMFHVLENPVVMFAGDIGAFPHRPAFMYYHYDNMTFVASGMGGGVQDNFIIVDVMSDHSIKYRLIALNGDNIHAWGNLKDFILP
ncbi:MAG: hypothetical protein D6722_28180 [Bacteroidetes bacterium]|nr:MAG: hypothetical protein D6722_28180 [Bacteroidota bacterium]